VKNDETNIAQPVADVVLARQVDGYPGSDIVYLTPEQNHLYKNVPQAIVRGPAGIGKTLLTNMKIVEIQQNHRHKKTLIIAPNTPALLFEQFCKSNGFQVTVCESFPPPPNSNNIIIMTLDNFFEVERETLLNYDITNYNLFVDDLQSLWLYGFDNNKCTFDDVVEFIDRVYNNVCGSDFITWFLLDIGQSYDANAEHTLPAWLLYNEDNTPRQLNIPVYVLDKVLRNSVEIASVIRKVRDIRVKGENDGETTVMTDITTGHNIHSDSVVYHKLNKWTGSKGYSEDWKKWSKLFVVERVKEMLEQLFTPNTTHMKYSDVSVLHDGFSSDFEQQVNDMLLTTYNIQLQTIEQYIITNNNTIICDHSRNVPSFESPVVVYVRAGTTSECDHYNCMSRARSKLIVLDIDKDQRPPLLTEEVILMEWEERGGSFHKL